MSPEKVHLTEEKATLLATLYGRALDARSPHPILGDRLAAETIERIDHDFGSTGLDAKMARAVALRARLVDRWAGEFLAARPDATVLHLGCGLDTRVHRMDPPPSVRWYDVDYPEVVELRRRLFPERPGHTLIGTSVTDLGWLEQVPADAPALVVAEGLFYYLDPVQGPALVRAIVDRFPGGAFVFDALSPLGLRLQRLNRPVRKAGATMHWAIDGPAELLAIHPGLRCLEALSAFDIDGFNRLSATHRAVGTIIKLVPALRRTAVFYRLEF
ncbi:class I SAM-dependent methyltransferase [Nonomuraea gerenzanensis]|uniref:Tetracenomycin polyketide synthesis O-methyltransferase TcmP n=1 Tax=Nonomuraea gerenzanensis TaxID=93944 RepID=A0A1M4ENP8_9ACTN|nr:class I SAM-dependent methyltransferase [Nonomuraea gerenzanensis]UBU11932.1 class I SAM-dependent methyltransferase [Nonomuraea gerenzanensis]SBP00444.1 Tetracenomycin polyketide synthesis O-methyltransferase TcmP [Nonomuraea gerenzanensis]